MTPSCVIVRIAGACAAAERADVIGKGAIPPRRWQPAHLAAKIGATSRQSGVPAAGEAVDEDESCAIAAASPPPTATVAPRISAIVRTRMTER
jgi:hypothetical protein